MMWSEFDGIDAESNDHVCKIDDKSIIMIFPKWAWNGTTLPETNIAPENGWLEY